MTAPHPTHAMSEDHLRCTKCGRWALTVEMRAPCLVVAHASQPRIKFDWSSINMEFSA